MADLNLAELEASVNALSAEEIRAQLVALKTKAKVNQKKYYNKDTAKRARDKKAEEIRLLVAAAQKAGIYDEVMAEADKRAQEQLDARAEADGAEDAENAA